MSKANERYFVHVEDSWGCGKYDILHSRVHAMELQGSLDVSVSISCMDATEGSRCRYCLVKMLIVVRTFCLIVLARTFVWDGKRPFFIQLMTRVH